MEQVKKYILEDLEKLNNAGLTKVYKFIRRDIIANISEQGSDIPVNSSDLLSDFIRFTEQVEQDIVNIEKEILSKPDQSMKFEEWSSPANTVRWGQALRAKAKKLVG